MRTIQRLIQGLLPILVASSTAAQTAGMLTLERWTFAPHVPSIEEFGRQTVNARIPDSTILTGGAEIPKNYADDYGARLRGSLVAPVTGRYVFYVSGDNLADLWLSASDAPFEKRRIAWHGLYTQGKQWDKYPTQRSETFWLQAGQAYYIEGLMYDYNAGDHLYLGWHYIEAASELSAVGVGNVTSQTWTDDGRTVSADAAAGDIWGTSDSFSFYNYRMVGDGEVTVHVDSVTAGHPYAQVGLMMRANLGESSRHAFVARTAGQGTAFKIRGTTAAQTVRPQPYVPDRDWLRIVRQGGTITGYHSQDGRTWRELGSQFFGNLPSAIYVGIAASNHPLSGGQPIQVTLDSFQIRRSQATEVIPATHLRSFVPRPDDLDDDQLPDSWEQIHQIGSNSPFGDDGQYGDPDGDGQNNFTEFAGGSDPKNPNSTSAPQGHLWVEQWENMPHYDLDSARADPNFYLPPGRSELMAGIEPRPLPQYSTTRLRGYLKVPEDGDYTFWVSNRYSGEIWLSDDETKYRKKRISYLSTAEGTGVGVRAFDDNYWDQYISQMSREVPLLAGRKYFFEVLVQQGHAADPDSFHHISIAWAGPDGVRRWLPLSALSGYLPEIADADDDYLPDAWESQHGLDPADNGHGNLTLEGERGDFDGDGLNNLEEYLLGTNPAEGDTDGDGLGDFAEVRTYGTEPTNSDSRAEELAQTVAATSVSGLGTSWVATEDGVTTASFRGAGAWNFAVPEDGFWVIEVEGRLLGNLNLSETLPMDVSIDNRSLGLDFMEFLNRGPGELRILTPWLKAGGHELGLFIDNYMARRTLEITAIKVLRPGGLDLDGDGQADAVQNRMRALNQVHAHQIYSHVSPFFIEGAARDPESVDLTVTHAHGNSDREKRFKWENQLPNFTRQMSSYEEQLSQALRNGDDRFGGEAVSHQLGAGEVSWYSFLNLDRNDAIGYVALFENHAISESRIVVWTPYNVLDGGEMSIPAGSEVLLGAWTSDNDNKNVTLTIGTEQIGFLAKGSHVHKFDIPGTYTVTASHPDGLTGTLTVHVKAAAFGNTLDTVEQTPREWKLDNIAAEFVLDGGLGGVSFTGEAALSSGGTRVTVMPTWPGTHRVAARLFENGPVLATGSVNVVGYSDALRNYANTSVGVEDGIVTIRSPMLLTHLPEGGYARITIFRAGVTFQDGSTEKIITAADLDENGVAHLYFLFPTSNLGGFCHYIDIFDANGVLISNG